jgi:hypothetical protein
MLLNLLTHVNRDPKLDLVESLFGTAKRLTVLFDNSNDVLVEIKLLEYIELLVKKFIEDKYQLKIDRVTMKIVSDINRILEKHSKHKSKCEKEDDSECTEDDTNTISSSDGY